MLGFIRSFIKSRFGAAVGLVVLGLIALAFAGADITGSQFGGVAGGDRAASVGKSRIDTSVLGKTIKSAFEQQRQENPQLTMKDFLAQGALDDVLSGLVDRTAMDQWGKKYGMVVSQRLVDSEIVKIPAFQGLDGKFSQEAYKQLIAQRGFTDAFVREDLGKGLMARQLLVPASFGAVLPRDAVMRYASLLKEKRDGSILFVPSQAFAPKAAPSDQQLGEFYKANAARYTLPERRTIRYAVFDETTLKNVPAPSDAEIQQRYKLNAAVYAPNETRTITQVIVPTEAAAKALVAEIAGGKSIDAAAAAAGLTTSKLAGATREALAGQSSKAVAGAVFATAQGKIATPAKGSLGWSVARVDAITRNAGKTLDQARPELVAALSAEKRRAALSDVSARAEEQFEKGTGLADVAKSLGLTVITSDPVQADGSIFGKPGQKAPAELGAVIQAAYAMEREGEAQVAEVQAGTKFAIFDVAQITAAAPAPLAAIRQQVQLDYGMAQGATGARAAAEKIMAALGRKVPLADAIKSVGTALPAPDQIQMTREQLTAMQPKIPGPLALMFSMAEGTSKKLEVPNKAGWVIVSLKDIEPGQLLPNDPLIDGASRELAQVAAREYSEQMRAAITKEIGVKRNETAINAVRTQLVGGQ